MSVLGAMYGATPEDVAQAQRALMAAAEATGAGSNTTGAVASGRSPVQTKGEPLPPNTPTFSGIDRWTMLELWARAVPPQYARLLRAPVLPDHPGREMHGQLGNG